MKLLIVLLLIGCATAQDPPKKDPPKKPKGQDPPGDEERRKKFLESKDAAGATKLVETNNPKNIDAVAAFFDDEEKSLESRLVALKALRLLKDQDEEEYKRVHAAVSEKLSKLASVGMKMSELKAVEGELIVECFGWHADMKYEHALLRMSNYLDPEITAARHTPLPDAVLVASALYLVRYPKSPDAREALWTALKHMKFSDKVRDQCYASLEIFHPKDRKEKVLALKADEQDTWLKALQKKLREGP